VVEAASVLQEQGKNAGALVFSHVWPLVPEQFMARLEGAREVVCVEGNSFGQFERLVRRETGFRMHRRIRRYDGLPITPEYILNRLDGRA
jgi:2-oxoglutarate ferredoxin oxidoreductase subunit alpha